MFGCTNGLTSFNEYHENEIERQKKLKADLEEVPSYIEAVNFIIGCHIGKLPHDQLLAFYKLMGDDMPKLWATFRVQPVSFCVMPYEQPITKDMNRIIMDPPTVIEIDLTITGRFSRLEFEIRIHGKKLTIKDKQLAEVVEATLSHPWSN